MQPIRFTGLFETIFRTAVSLATAEKADGVLLLLEGPTDWQKLRNEGAAVKIIVAADNPEQMQGAGEAGLLTVSLDAGPTAVYDRLSQAVLESVADDLLEPGSRVVVLYSGFDASTVDSISLIALSDHLGRLTVRDLRQLETSVPLDTLQTVVNLALEIGREGREGKPVGTMFVVGDHRKVVECSHPQGFDPVRGYKRKDRDLKNARVREGVKEIAQLDGAFIIAADGTVHASCQYIDAPATDITLSKGLGSRHWAAAAISRATKCIAVAVSESNGTVRLFQNGEVILRIEPFRRPMKWKEFEYEPPEPPKS